MIRTALTLLAALTPASNPRGAAAPAAQDAPWTFVDVAAEAGVDFESTFGDNEFSFILEDTGAGLAVLDFDGDGHRDLYFVNGAWIDGVSDPAARPASMPSNRLYRGRGDGTFDDVTASAGVGDTGYGFGAVVGDADGDGDEDLYVLNWGPNVYYQNRGDGTFVDATAEVGLGGPATLNGQRKWSVNGFFFDADGDADLDLYVANYLAFDPGFVDPELPEEYPYSGPESYAGQASLLYRNDGGRFVDVTPEAGLLRPDAKTMGAAAADLDGDGDLDIVEALDSTPNLMFQSGGDGTFQDAGDSSGLGYDRDGKPMAAMHACCGDPDADGDVDVFVPDLEFGCLYRNNGRAEFAELSAESGLPGKDQGSGWGSAFADFDNDGHLDLLVILGGAFSLEGAESDRLLRGRGDGSFEDVSAALGGYFATRRVGRGVAVTDIDRDGDLDFVVQCKEVGRAPAVVRNDLSGKNHWLMLDLRGTASNRDAVGARVELRAGGRRQYREVGRATSYLSSGDRRVHFGLGAERRAELTVRWPSGTVQTLALDSVDTVVRLVEPASGN